METDGAEAAQAASVTAVGIGTIALLGSVFISDYFEIALISDNLPLGVRKPSSEISYIVRLFRLEYNAFLSFSGVMNYIPRITGEREIDRSSDSSAVFGFQ